VVEAALVDHMHRQLGRLQQRGHVLGEGGCAGCVVAQREELGVEIAEVVDRLVLRTGQQDRLTCGGVGRSDDDRLRPAEGRVDRGAEPREEGTGHAGLERDHR
jgi:hypothetical protein